MCIEKCNLVSLTDSKDYDVFGTQLSVTNVLNSLYESTVSTSYGYLGKPYDATTRLYNYGYRDYSSRIGRFTTVDPIRDGSNWYAYVNNDPVNYVDLWGLFSFKELGSKLAKTYSIVSMAINTTQPLGQPVSEPVESEYKKQFTTEAEQEKSWLSVLSWVGTIPGPIGTAFSVLTDAAALNSTASNDIVVFNSRKAFIVGAEQELQRIETELSNQKTTAGITQLSSEESYTSFLQTQYQLLRDEIQLNRDFDQIDIKYDNGQNRPQEPESWVTPVDYKSAYKNK